MVELSKANEVESNDLFLLYQKDGAYFWTFPGDPPDDYPMGGPFDSADAARADYHAQEAEFASI